MKYEDTPLLRVLNHFLADGFEASEECDVLVWVGQGKTLGDLIGHDEARDFYASPKRQEEIGWVINTVGLDLLEDYLNDTGAPNALRLRYQQGEFVIFAGDPNGRPFITTESFQRQRATL